MKSRCTASTRSGSSIITWTDQERRGRAPCSACRVPAPHRRREGRRACLVSKRTWSWLPLRRGHRLTREGGRGQSSGRTAPPVTADTATAHRPGETCYDLRADGDRLGSRMPKRLSEAERRGFREAGYCGPLRAMSAGEAQRYRAELERFERRWPDERPMLRPGCLAALPLDRRIHPPLRPARPHGGSARPRPAGLGRLAQAQGARRQDLRRLASGHRLLQYQGRSW